MKNALLLIVMFIGNISYCQQEIKVDLLDALALKTMEISYEYNVSKQSSVGLSILLNLESKTADFRYNEKNMITPYFRHSFTQKPNWNMFGELFFSFNSGDKELDPIVGSNLIRYTTYSDGALGVAIGTKYVSEAGFLMDIHGGLGRNLFNDDAPSIVPRVGLNVGYRF